MQSHVEFLFFREKLTTAMETAVVVKGAPLDEQTFGGGYQLV